MSMAADLPELTFDVMVQGQIYARRHYDITAELIDAYSTAIGAPRRMVARSGGCATAQLAPPTLPAMWTPPRICCDRWRIPVGGIHTRQEWQSFAPVVADAILELELELVRKWVERERRFVLFESRFRDTSGALVARGRMTVLWPK